MFTAVTPLLILLAAAATSVRADPDPNNPGPGDVFIEGQPCSVGWNIDPTGIWKTMNIDLMTGDNFNMIYLATVATVDGTNPNKNTFSFTCPQVTPHSPIYFYQFSSSAASNKTWTGRFTITDSASHVEKPVNTTQPDGQQIPWGTGALVNGSMSSTAPTVGATPTSTQASKSSGSVAGTSASSSSASSVTGAPGLTLTPTTATTRTPTVVVVSLTSSAAATPSAGSTTNSNGAAALGVSSTVFQTSLALVLTAVGFVAMF